MEALKEAYSEEPRHGGCPGSLVYPDAEDADAKAERGGGSDGDGERRKGGERRGGEEASPLFRARLLPPKQRGGKRRARVSGEGFRV